MDVDTSKWSGEGEFTPVLVDRLRDIPVIEFVRVEDAPASRSEADYNFISNEIYVAFAKTPRTVPGRLLGFIPRSRTVLENAATITELEGRLCALDGIGPPDYSDASMLQYLRAERIIPPYQTRGYKLVELVRIYEVGTSPTNPI